MSSRSDYLYRPGWAKPAWIAGAMGIWLMGILAEVQPWWVFAAMFGWYGAIVLTMVAQTTAASVRDFLRDLTAAQRSEWEAQPWWGKAYLVGHTYVYAFKLQVLRRTPAER